MPTAWLIESREGCFLTRGKSGQQCTEAKRWLTLF